MRKIVLGVTGSIAAYKAAELVREMQKRDWDVRVVMTAAATRFITPLTFRTLTKHFVSVDAFEPTGEWMPQHIDLATWADAIVVAPCSANILAKAAHGLADDLLSETLLAARCPVFFAPSMNVAMYENPATQANIALLRSRGLRVIGPDAGALACGTTGKGRLAEISAIADAVAADFCD